MINFSRLWIVTRQKMQNSRDPDHRLRVQRLQKGLLRLQEDGGFRGPGGIKMLRHHAFHQVQTKVELQQVQAVDNEIVRFKRIVNGVGKFKAHAQTAH